MSYSEGTDINQKPALISFNVHLKYGSLALSLNSALSSEEGTHPETTEHRP